MDIITHLFALVAKNRVGPTSDNTLHQIGKKAVQLDAANRCSIFGRPERPACCSGLQPSFEMCGSAREHAMQWLARLEAATSPG